MEVHDMVEQATDATAPAGITKDDIEFDEGNPNLARAIPRGEGRTLSEKRVAVVPHSSGTYPDIVEGSDSERAGTSWGVPGVEDAAVAETPDGVRAECTGDEEASPNRNTGDRLTRDDLQNVGSWSTIDTKDSAGSPTGNS
jgi:hypothetical protein